MAANNPRNPVNKADDLERELIEMFNKNRKIKKHRDIIKLNGKRYLYFAMPFLENKPRCLICHGKRDAAPIQLQMRYEGIGGFDEKVGDIRAIESIRAPLEEEYSAVYIISAALVSGLTVIIALFFFNRRLSIWS